MRFIEVNGYTVKLGMEEAHQQWMAKNEKKLADAHPAGTRYIGTFVTVFSSDKGAGSYRTFVELDSYGAMDKLAEASKDSKSKLGRLLREWAAFGDYDLDAPWSHELHKAVVDASIWDPTTG
jgi:hypothetical protein